MSEPKKKLSGDQKLLIWLSGAILLLIVVIAC